MPGGSYQVHTNEGERPGGASLATFLEDLPVFMAHKKAIQALQHKLDEVEWTNDRVPVGASR